MAGGDTGAPRAAGQASGWVALDPKLPRDVLIGFLYSDAFTKREKANEDYAIRLREKEKLLELKKKLAEQHEHLKKLEEHM